MFREALKVNRVWLPVSSDDDECDRLYVSGLRSDTRIRQNDEMLEKREFLSVEKLRSWLKFPVAVDVQASILIDVYVSV